MPDGINPAISNGNHTKDRMKQITLLTYVARPPRPAQPRDGGFLRYPRQSRTPAGPARLLDQSGIPYQVVVFHSLTNQDAGCLYRLNGDEYLYSERGSAKVVPARVGRDAAGKSARARRSSTSLAMTATFTTAASSDATCAFASYKHNPHIVWAGRDRGAGHQPERVRRLLLPLRLDRSWPSRPMRPTPARSTSRKTATNPRRADALTAQAQRGDMSWYDSSALIFADHHIQAVTTFKGQFGRPR